MGRTSPKLTDRLRDGVVCRFACCYTHDEVRTWLKDEHGIDLPPPALSYYNANNPAARAGLSEKWRKRFDQVQAEYFEATSSVPIAHKAHRLRIANRAVERIAGKIDADRGVNVVMVDTLRSLLEYAAKEQGEAYTNRRILEHDAHGALAKLIGCDPSELPEPSADA